MSYCREFITVPQGAVLSPITVVSSAGGGMQQWQTIKTSGAPMTTLAGGQQVRSIMTTSDPNVITVNGAVLSPAPGQQYVQAAGQNAVQTYYTTADVGSVAAVTPTPIVVGKKSKAGPASRTVVQTVPANAVSSANIIDVKNVTPLPQAVLQQVHN